MLEVSEIAVGGGLCGSVFLNRRFEMMVRKRLGATLYALHHSTTNLLDFPAYY